MTIAQLSPRRKLASLLGSPTTRLDVYRKVRQAFKGVKALCAATASEYLIRAGVLSGYRPWTSQLESDLKKKGWTYVGATRASPENRPGTTTAGDARLAPTQVGGTGVSPVSGNGAKDSRAMTPVPPDLKFADLCYTVDSNRNNAPDHVFFFIRWLDRAKLIAEVVDNYSPHPHPRNLGAPQWYGSRRLAYGQFSHAQRMP